MDQTASFQTPGFIRTKGVPRPAASYRAARRNSVKSARMLSQWRLVAAEDANKSAYLYGRAVMANNAREVAAKALVGNRAGIPALVAAEAMLVFYRGEKQTRVVRRIIRDLEAQVRSVGRK